MKNKMKIQNKILFGLVIGLCVLFAGDKVLAASNNSFLDLLASKVASLLLGGNGEQSLSGTFTSNPSNLTASDEWQAVNSLFEYGDLEVDGTTYLDGAVTSAGGLTSTGDTRTASLVQTGSIATFATTSAATAANVCNNPVWSSTSNGVVTTTITLPATSTLFADCLTTNGDSITFSVINADTVTSTVLAAGTGGTALYESSLTIAAGKAALVRIVRDAATTYKALIVSLDN